MRRYDEYTSAAHIYQASKTLNVSRWAGEARLALAVELVQQSGSDPSLSSSLLLPFCQNFVSTLSQYLDKLQTLIYAHLLSILAPRVLAQHETPSFKQHKLFKQDPRTLVAHLAKRALVSEQNKGGCIKQRVLTHGQRALTHGRLSSVLLPSAAPQAIGDELFELDKMTPHAPGFEDRLKHIMQVWYQLSSAQHSSAQLISRTQVRVTRRL